MIVALGEMMACMPRRETPTSYVARFIHPLLGGCHELDLLSPVGTNLWRWNGRPTFYRVGQKFGLSVLVFFRVLLIFNFLPTRSYGMAELGFATIKGLTLNGFLVHAICVFADAVNHRIVAWPDDENHLREEIFSTFHTRVRPGAFAPLLVDNNDALGKFVGFCAVSGVAGFSYQGTKLVIIALGKAHEGPSTAIPSVIKQNHLSGPVHPRWSSFLRPHGFERLPILGCCLHGQDW
ncbi:hypothetical protein K470DRAFT_265364 [Piedraia hortae CBS 480.64]|uniref:Amino acid permease/ SLC12A domain-containing protein n=1 Tax=Piedraia hortae CBS 480.64 TaxID=1314780 RepID=A0A6A7BVY7_9PEZI|nr:hypothetical protein K470DRAFT_265364 [Piedraia hortae CBS 480.64]